MELIEETEAKGMDVDAFRMCIADVSRELESGAFAQGERPWANGEASHSPCAALGVAGAAVSVVWAETLLFI